MNAAVFDTFDAARVLESSGVECTHAETTTSTIGVRILVLLMGCLVLSPFVRSEEKPDYHAEVMAEVLVPCFLS